MTPKFTISRFMQSDAASAAQVILQFTQREPPADRLKTFLASDAHLFLVAAIRDLQVGLAYAYELQRPEGDAMLFLYSIDVLPEYRRQGVATALLSHLRQLAAARQIKKLFAFTTHSNKAAVKFYQVTGGVMKNGDDLLFEYPTAE